jgi:hypothetical protein
MRIYIIGNDGITLCREAPATVNDGEIAVASNEELHAAPLNAAFAATRQLDDGDKQAGSHRTWRADFPHQRSSAVGSQHCERLQLRVWEAQFRWQ